MEKNYANGLEPWSNSGAKTSALSMASLPARLRPETNHFSNDKPHLCKCSSVSPFSMSKAHYSSVCLGAGVLAGILGFGVLAGGFAWLARIVSAVLLALFCWSLIERQRLKKLRPVKGSFAQSFNAGLEKDKKRE